MKKSEMYNTLLDKVCEVCEVDRRDIINHKKCQDVVEARIIAVQYLRRIGLSADDISRYSEMDKRNDWTYKPTEDEIRKKSKTINNLFNSYSAKCLESFAFCLLSKDIQQYCAEQYKEYYLSWMKPLKEK